MGALRLLYRPCAFEERLEAQRPEVGEESPPAFRRAGRAVPAGVLDLQEAFGRWQDVTLVKRQCTDYDKRCTDCRGVDVSDVSEKVLGLRVYAWYRACALLDRRLLGARGRRTDVAPFR